MTPDQIELVQRTFRQVAPLGDTVADLFYTRLFEIDPDLRPMFTGDMAGQGRKLLKMLTVAVNGLSQLDQLVPHVQALGQRHVGYGVKPDHYVTVGIALMWTLSQGLGDEFTNDVRAAWFAAYETLAQTMMNAPQANAA